MKQSEVAEFVYAILEAKGDKFNHVETANLKDDVGVDSLDIIEVSMEIERKYRISIPNDVIENFLVAGDIINAAVDGLKVVGTEIE